MNAQPTNPYDLAYQVKDDHTYIDFGHEESSDGKVVSGSYNVLLPGGRVGTVTYTVGGYNGPDVKVTYSREAEYPEY